MYFIYGERLQPGGNSLAGKDSFFSKTAHKSKMEEAVRAMKKHGYAFVVISGDELLLNDDDDTHGFLRSIDM